MITLRRYLVLDGVDPDAIDYTLRHREPREALARLLDGRSPIIDCECQACDCSEVATTSDDGGVPVCAECETYVVDDDGDVHCSRCEDVEIVQESCGAGQQTRTYARLKPPARPDADPAGEWACYWDTVGDDGHIVSRHATREAAEQAVLAHDWPKPGDRTAYLCGYCVRRVDVDGQVLAGEEE